MAVKRYSSKSSNYRGFSYKPRSVKRLENKLKRNIIIGAVLGVVFIYFMLTYGLPVLIGSLSSFNKKTIQASTDKSVLDSGITPPVFNIPFEATNSASLNIQGYTAPNQKVEVYLNDELKNTVVAGSDGDFNIDSLTLTEGNNYIYGLTIKDNKKSLPSKRINVEYSSAKPKLEVSSPSDNQQIKGGDKKVYVSGSTDPESTITVNGMSIIVNNDGSFGMNYTINDGDNTLNIVATNGVGNTSTTSRKVNYAAS